MVRCVMNPRGPREPHAGQRPTLIIPAGSEGSVWRRNERCVRADAGSQFEGGRFRAAPPLNALICARDASAVARRGPTNPHMIIYFRDDSNQFFIDFQDGRVGLGFRSRGTQQMSMYKVDAAHSEVGFVVRHMMFAKVRGQFKNWTAEVEYDSADPLKSKVKAEIETGSVDTREGARDAHLRSADFFDAENFPKMIFSSKRIEAAGKGRYKLVGDLTIRNQTNEVTLEVEETGRGKDPWGNDRIGFAAKGSISREKWGLTWNQALEAGGVLVSDKVDIEIEAQVIESK